MKVCECMTREVRLASPDWTLKDAAVAMAECDSGSLPVGENDRLVGMITDRDIAIRGVASGKGPDATVGEAMTREVRYCFEDDDIDEVLEQMSARQIRRMPVLSREKRMVGIVSLSDMAQGSERKHAGETLHHIARPGGEHNQSLH